MHPNLHEIHRVMKNFQTLNEVFQYLNYFLLMWMERYNIFNKIQELRALATISQTPKLCRKASADCTDVTYVPKEYIISCIIQHFFFTCAELQQWHLFPLNSYSRTVSATAVQRSQRFWYNIFPYHEHLFCLGHSSSSPGRRSGGIRTVLTPIQSILHLK